MLIEILISISLGILAGVVTGIIPGVHINLVGTILIPLSASAFSSVNSIYLIIFISSMAISHTFHDFIPSIFLGCPEEDTQLSILPGHEMLQEGNGYEAVRLTSRAGLYAVFILLLIAFPISFLISEVYDFLHSIMFYVLLAVFLLLIFQEKKKFTALFVFLISGILGLCVLNSSVKEPLLPLLTGLFGSSLLITSIRSKISLPPQTINEPRYNMFKPLLGSVIASPICGFLPGLGSGQAAILANSISKTDRKGFLALVGATNVLVMGLSFVSLYAISKTRTGAAAAIQQLIGTLSWKSLILILLACLASGIISFFLTKPITKFFSQKVSKINYSNLSIGVLIFLTAITLLISGFLGLLILTASTLLGIYCNTLPVKKTHMMGCLLVPTILYYAMSLF